MTKPAEFYKKELQKQETILQKLKKQLSGYSFLRLAVFLITAYGLYFFYGNTIGFFTVLFAGLILFVFLVSRYNDLFYEKKKTLAKKAINQLEIDVLNGDIDSLDPGDEFKNPEHHFSYDIDLFGEKSFFQYLNRTQTRDGKNMLAGMLTANAVDHILQKQDAVKELAGKTTWRQNYSATAQLMETDTESETIIKWIKEHQNFVSKSFKWIPAVFGTISVLLIFALAFNLIPFSVLFLWFAIGVSIIFFHIKKIQILYDKTSRMKDNFSQYHRLLNLIETENFQSGLLKKKQAEIRSEFDKASVILKGFSTILNAFDQRNNMFVGIVGNGLFLWDLTQSYRVERWMVAYKNHVENWFSAIAYFDAMNSLANYAFNHPEYRFPILSDNRKIIVSKDLGHPLIDPKKRIANDFEISATDFYIVTGANMAGKSTFLRTVSLAIVMANTGLPVCARRFDYRPIKLITSMRTSDSLSKDESYFFSELKRLKFIVDEIKNDAYFIILDEILKGTNSKDKAAGSKKFVKKLVASGSTGIIATHDLSLCEIESEYEQIHNRYFDAEIIDGELYFDYKLKTGICKNMNASFLLKKMEIV